MFLVWRFFLNTEKNEEQHELQNFHLVLLEIVTDMYFLLHTAYNSKQNQKLHHRATIALIEY